VAVTVLSPSLAFAQDAAPIQGALDWLIGLLQGAIARSVAIVAVCFLGFLAMTGRLAWGLAGSIIIGIALVFGATSLVDSLRSAIR
jgi:type IV secretion system protein VirB2